MYRQNLGKVVCVGLDQRCHALTGCWGKSHDLHVPLAWTILRRETMRDFSTIWYLLNAHALQNVILQGCLKTDCIVYPNVETTTFHSLITVKLCLWCLVQNVVKTFGRHRNSFKKMCCWPLTLPIGQDHRGICYIVQPVCFKTSTISICPLTEKKICEQLWM